MADTKLKAHASQPAQPHAGAAEEDEVYSTLGALLGTLEVVTADAEDEQLMAPPQLARLRSASGYVRRIQHQVEALLILAGEDLGERLRRAHVKIAPLVEHAVRSAKRALDARGVSVRFATREAWGEAKVLVDGSRVDRALGALVEALAGSVGSGGAIDVAVRPDGRQVRVELWGIPQGPQRAPRPADALGEESTLASGLLQRASQRLFALQGCELTVDVSQLSLRLVMPISEAT